MAKEGLGTSEQFTAEKVAGADPAIQNPQSKIQNEPMIRFASASDALITSVSHGEYSRKFTGRGPWEATEQEWDLFLKNTGVFKIIQN